MNSDICLILHSQASATAFSTISAFIIVYVLSAFFWCVLWRFDPWVWLEAQQTCQVSFGPMGPNQSLDQCSVLSSEKRLGLSSPRWERRAYSVDRWFTKDGSLQVLHWPFSRGCLVQLFASLAADFKPIFIFCRSQNDHLVSLRCVKHCHPHDQACQSDLAHLITYTSLSLPTITDLTEPEGKLWHRWKVPLSSHLMNTNANASSLRYNLPADQYSVQILSSIRRHRHLLRHPLRGRRVLFWGSKASSPGDDHR